jgi:putative transposase
MFYAAAQLCSIFAACGRLRDAPSDQAVRDALVALCPEAETLEQQLNASFAAQLPKAEVRPSLLLLDRGFYSMAIIRHLQAARYPFIMPVIIRGRKADHCKGPSGTRGFALWKRSGWSRYTLTSADHRKATVSIGVHCRNWCGQRRRHGRQTLV